MIFLESPEGGIVAQGIIVEVHITPTGVQGLNRNGKMALWIGVEDELDRLETLRLVREWVRAGKKATQPDWSFLKKTPNEKPAPLPSEKVEPKRGMGVIDGMKL